MSFPMDDPAAPAQLSPSPMVGDAQQFRIKRNGARPLRFAGTELAMAMSYTPELAYWYEINLYRASGGSFFVAIRLFHQTEDKTDTVEAWEFESLEDALWKIESYDAASDIDLVVEADIDTQPAAVIATKMLDLSARIAAARQHYRGLAGEFLGDLDGG